MGTIVLDRLTKVFADGTVAVDALSLDVAPGEFLVLLGPTGCGKSTVLRLVAGLEEPTSGQVILDGRRIDRLRTRDRNVAMVFQDFALYPHLTVADNIGFPLRVSQVAEAEKAARVREVAEVLGIGDLLRKLPGQLSGGQRQRVAMARAVVRRPAAFLLDEPMSNLDAHLREDLRAEIVALTRRFGVTTLYVTHDRTEALTMGDRVAVLRRGQLQQLGAPTEVYADPATLFVAAFLGPGQTSLLQAAVYAEPDGTAAIDLGSQVLRLPAGDPRAATLAAHHGARVVVGIRADALSVEPDGLLRGTVRAVEDLGHEAVVHVDTGAVPVAPAATRLDLPDPDVDLARVIGRDRPPTSGLRQAWSRIVPHQPPPEPPPTARTEYGFYPRYEAAEQGRDNRSDLLLRVTRPAPVPRTGEPVALAVDLDRVYVFDGSGARLV